VGKKPIDKITVRDVVDECGINRNTFYYYFQDIYAVLERLCGALTDALPQNAALTETATAFFEKMQEFYNGYTKAARSLLLSLGGDGLERYFAPALDRLIRDCLLREVQPAPSEARLLHATVFVRRAVFGYCIEALQNVRAEQWQGAGEDLTLLLSGLMSALQRGNSDKI
jgi:AcrR family transcriptional regulator